METLSDQLTELYESKWDGLMTQLEANGLKDQLQCPFLISLYRSGQEKEEREKAQEADANWYAKKPMLIGMQRKLMLSMKSGIPKQT